MKLYFKTRYNEYHLVNDNVNSDTAIKEITDYVHKINPKYKIHYIRTTAHKDFIWYDVGSHTEFFYLTDKDLINAGVAQ